MKKYIFGLGLVVLFILLILVPCMFGKVADRPTSEWQATAYCKGHTTFSGNKVVRGIVAADPKVLPIGSVVRVSTYSNIYNGIYTVLDTGSAIKGNILDLYMWSCDEALDFGRRTVNVEVLRLGWDPNGRGLK